MKFLAFFFLFLFVLTPTLTFAIELNLDYPEFGGFDLNNEEDQSLTPVIAWLYYLILSIGGIAAFVMLVWAGVQWVTSAGNSGKLSDARDRATKAILGLVLILSSFLIIQAINPDLVVLEDPSLPDPPSGSEGGAGLPTVPSGEDLVLVASEPSVEPGDSITLSWNASETLKDNPLILCLAYSDPGHPDWDGRRTTSGETPSVGPLEEGTYTFTLDCTPPGGSPLQTSVTVVAGDGLPPEDVPDPTLNLLINSAPFGTGTPPSSGGQKTLRRSELDNEGDEIWIYWTSTNATTCIGEDLFAPRGSMDPSGSLLFFVGSNFFASPPTYTYSLRCTNSAGESVVDTVQFIYD